MSFKREAQHAAPVRIVLHFQLPAMVKIEVAHAGFRSDFYLCSVHVVFVAVNDGPNGLVVKRPAAGKHTIWQHGRHGLPAATHQKRSNRTLNSRHAARGLGVPGVNPVPDTPDVFPALPADSVEKSKLKVISFDA